VKLSPKVQANIASFTALSLFLLADVLYGDHLSFHTWNYLALLSFLASMLVYMWVHNRATAKLPAAPAPKAELNLAEERLPRSVWLAVAPPLLVALELWWVTTHWNELPWRDESQGSLAYNSSYRFLVGSLIFWNGVGTWMALFGLAVWHGMSRAYEFRRTQLLAGVMNQWAGFILINGSMLRSAFELPDSVEWVALVPLLASTSVLIWNSRRLNRLYAAVPRIGTWFYRDRHDPTFFGPRGVNLASGWSMVLIAAVIPPIALAEWMLHRVQG
jgi:hypothetical protein